MERVFICYSRKDESFVDRLVADLKAAGVPTWRDVDDIPKHKMASIESWRVAVQEGLQLCDHMIVVVSPDSVSSPEVQAEWNYFLRHSKPVHPVFYRDCDMPYRLFALNWWDFRESYDQFTNLLDVLPRTKLITLPADLEAAVNSQFDGVREAAVIELVRLMEGSDPALAHLAWAALERLAGDYNRKVSAVARAALDPASTPPTPARQVAIPAPEPIHDPILDILPAPSEWCEIPAGQVKIKGMIFDVHPFLMAKYPTTYEQFQVFIDDQQGFKNPKWWSALAASNRHRNAGHRQHFTHARNLPCENVSWYDAIAFCRWLSSKVGYQVRLPTEWEWRWAAQGPDGRRYPWGNDFDSSRCNTSESGLRKTTPVGSYPYGASPYGVLDMSGNVWEWCLNEHNNLVEFNISSDKLRVLRGGSCYRSARRAYAAFRNWNSPDFRSDDYGFRVVVGSDLMLR